MYEKYICDVKISFPSHNRWETNGSSKKTHFYIKKKRNLEKYLKNGGAVD